MSDDLAEWLPRIVAAIEEWEDSHGPFTPFARAGIDGHEALIEECLGRLTGDMYPFFHPHYAGQMLKPPHRIATLGYVAAMLINPNNHALDGGPATGRMEREVVADLAAMVGFDQPLGHLTSSGTIANLEALWVGRRERPGSAIAVSADAHYTHTRMAEVLGIDAVVVPSDSHGRMSVTALEDALRTGRVGTVVATLGTTGLGAVDPLDRIILMARDLGARVHVDAAYGGFFRIIADELGGVSSAYAAMRDADSIVIDPHKHGLQPYGCGAVLFADPSVGRHYRHDSPYTYFTSDELHLGEISLECSRAGASAAALWLTTRAFPLTREGLGTFLAPCVSAARTFHELLESDATLQAAQSPDLDIVGYLTRRDTMSAVDRDTSAVFTSLAQAPADEQMHVATYGMEASALNARGIPLRHDQDAARILRSVFMKPEHGAAISEIHSRISQAARHSMTI
jgi:glutamate/tyrosine decarboxylase-like PLP-dependent enzyme